MLATLGVPLSRVITTPLFSLIRIVSLFAAPRVVVLRITDRAASRFSACPEIGVCERRHIAVRLEASSFSPDGGTGNLRRSSQMRPQQRSTSLRDSLVLVLRQRRRGQPKSPLRLLLSQ